MMILIPLMYYRSFLTITQKPTSIVKFSFNNNCNLLNTSIKYTNSRYIIIVE